MTLTAVCLSVRQIANKYRLSFIAHELPEFRIGTPNNFAIFIIWVKFN
jgi:hypothetical protein